VAHDACAATLAAAVAFACLDVAATHSHSTVDSTPPESCETCEHSNVQHLPKPPCNHQCLPSVKCVGLEQSLVLLRLQWCVCRLAVQQPGLLHTHPTDRGCQGRAGGVPEQALARSSISSQGGLSSTGPLHLLTLSACPSTAAIQLVGCVLLCGSLELRSVSNVGIALLRQTQDTVQGHKQQQNQHLSTAAMLPAS